MIGRRRNQPYGDFSAHCTAGWCAQRVAADATIEVTRRCPLKCAHCYNNLPMGDLAREARRVDRATSTTASSTSWPRPGASGSSTPAARSSRARDFLDIYTYAKQKGFLITLFTNGTLITPRIADHLAEWRPFSIEITLYGATKETYEALTGIPGSYDHCLRGIHLLLERRLPLKLKTVAVSINKHEIGAMKKLAEGLGAGVQVRRHDEPPHRLLPEPAGGAAAAVGDREDGPRGPGAGRRVEAVRGAVQRARRRASAATRSTSAAAGSTDLPSTRKGG